MVGDPALRVVATQAGAGVAALLLDAGRGLTALRAHEALGPAVGRGADHALLAGADAHSVTLSELTVGAAGVRVAGVQLLHNGHASGDEGALSDGVPGVAQQAGAHWLVAVGVAHRVDAAHAGARVHTLVVDTGSVGGAVGVEDTFGATCQVGVTEVSWDTGAGSCPGSGSAVSIRAAGRGVTRVQYLCCPHSCALGYESALSEWIPIVTSWTSADWLVVDNLTFCIGTTGARAGINTSLLDTGSVAGAVWVNTAFRSAVGRSPNVVRKTCAGSNLSCVIILTLGEGSTGRWVAGIYLFNDWSWWWCGDLHSDTVAEWVPGEARGTLADGIVVGHLAPGIVTAGAWAGVHTLLVDTGGQLATVRADHTLGSAVWRVSLVAWDTGADTHTINLPVLTVGTTGIGVTWVSVHLYGFWWGDEGAGRGGISLVAWVAGADGVVIPDRALGMDTTGARAGVLALLLHTGKMVGAFSVDQTFWSAANIWITNVVLDTSAGTSSSSL